MARGGLDLHSVELIITFLEKSILVTSPNIYSANLFTKLSKTLPSTGTGGFFFATRSEPRITLLPCFRCTVYNVNSKQCTLHTLHYSKQRTLHTLHYSVQCTLHTLHYSVQCTLHTLHYSVQCTLHTKGP